MPIKVGDLIVTKINCGSKEVREFTVGNKVKYCLDSAVNWNSSLANYTFFGRKEGEESTHSTQFIYQDNTNTQTISTTTFTDSELEELQNVLDQAREGVFSKKSYKFNCAYKDTLYLPQWMRNRLSSGEITVTCTLSADVWTKTTVNQYLFFGNEAKPGNTEVFLLIKKNSTPTISSKLSSGAPGNKTKPYYLENSGHLSQTITLDSTTTAITVACMTNCIRTAGARSTDSFHEANFSNITIEFTIN